jgi:hypothetical protein
VNRWDLPGARRKVLLVACWCILFLSAIGTSSTAAGSSWLAVISIVPVATAAPQTVLSVLGRLVVGQGGPGVAVGAGHGERQAVSCRSGSVAVGRNWMPVVSADVALCGRSRRRLGGQPGRRGGRGAAARVCVRRGGHRGGQVHPPAGVHDEPTDTRFSPHRARENLGTDRRHATGFACTDRGMEIEGSVGVHQIHWC